MLIFDYDIRELKDILTRFSRLFGLSEEQLNDLLVTFNLLILLCLTFFLLRLVGWFRTS